MRLIKRNTALRLIAEVKEAFGIPIKVVDKSEGDGAGGGACLVTETIDLYGLDYHTQGGLLSTLLHEVCHVLCKRRGIYPAFHSPKSHVEMTDQELRAHILTAWRAECYVERMAKGLMQAGWPGHVYQFSYGPRKIEKAWFDLHYLLDFKLELRRRMLRRIDKERRALAA